ncbi:MAG: hypothetical protein AMXMBFR34_52340 [Myxococcaceae bacterium]
MPFQGLSMTGIGGYLSPEPMLQDPEYVRDVAQQGLSLPTYAYAANNPLMYTDETGLYPFPSDEFTECYRMCLDKTGRVSQYLLPIMPVHKTWVPPFRFTPFGGGSNEWTTPLSSAGNMAGGRSSAIGSGLRTAGRIGAWLRWPLLIKGYADVAECAYKCSKEESIADQTCREQASGR